MTTAIELSHVTKTYPRKRRFQHFWQTLVHSNTSGMKRSRHEFYGSRWANYGVYRAKRGGEVNHN